MAVASRPEISTLRAFYLVIQAKTTDSFRSDRFPVRPGWGGRVTHTGDESRV